MMLSMTGFAAAAATRNELSVSVELRSVNSRFLDIVLKLPADLRHAEERLRARIGARLTRGRVEAEIKLDDPGSKEQAFDIDPLKARGLAKVLAGLKALDIDVRLALGDLTGPAGVLKASAARPEQALITAALDEALDQALEALVAMRGREGQAIAADLKQRLDWMAAQVTQIEALAGSLPALFYQRLQERLATLAGSPLALDPQRLAQAAAVLADRCDISEEIVRARSHLDQFAVIMADDDPAGRKLNFLIQELNRECNTIGSKAGQAQIAHLAVALKSELEKIREQVQNIE